MRHALDLWCRRQLDPKRRGFLRDTVRPAAPLRPPWTGADYVRYTASCTRCDDCIRACPQQLLEAGDGGFPQIVSSARARALCGACVAACLQHALRPVPDTPPWTLQPLLADTCLARPKVECRVCGDACDASAIRFRPALGGVSPPAERRGLHRPRRLWRSARRGRSRWFGAERRRPISAAPDPVLRVRNRRC